MIMFALELTKNISFCGLIGESCDTSVSALFYVVWVITEWLYCSIPFKVSG